MAKTRGPEPPFCEECLKEGGFVRTQLDKDQTKAFKSGRTVVVWVCPNCHHVQMENYLHGRIMR